MSEDGIKTVEFVKTANGVKAKLVGTSNDTAPKTSTVEPIVNDLKTLSVMVQRLQLAARAGIQFGGARDLYSVFGYKVKVTPEDFLAKYVRQDITTRIIDAPPGATWSIPPIMTDETRQTEWQALNRRVKLWNAMYRADRLARLNTFSILVFGFDKGSLHAPLKPGSAKELHYVRAFGARAVSEMKYIKDPNNPKFGFPEFYTIGFDESNVTEVGTGNSTTKGLNEIRVHHSRVVHIVENALEDQVFGTPIIEKVYNLLDDLLKVSGGTAETYWLTGNRGIQANVDKDMEISPDDAAALSDEIDEYMHQLRRFIRTRGVELNVLDSKPPSPKEVFSMIMALISGTTGIPQRILIGSEAGQLASEQDRANWAERIDERRALFAGPEMLEPTIDILQMSGVMKEGDVDFEWPDAFVQNPLEKAQTMAQQARAIGNISRQTGNKMPMQLTSRTEGRAILGLEGELDESEILETEPEVIEVPVGEEDAGKSGTSPGADDKPKPDED